MRIAYPPLLMTITTNKLKQQCLKTVVLTLERQQRISICLIDRLNHFDRCFGRLRTKIPKCIIPLYSMSATEFLVKHKKTVIAHPLYSSDFSPCYFFLFSKLKHPLPGRHYDFIDPIYKNHLTNFWRCKQANTKFQIHANQYMEIKLHKNIKKIVPIQLNFCKQLNSLYQVCHDVCYTQTKTSGTL